MSAPVCTIIAGPNGAGNTTFALTHLPEVGCRTFVNADMISVGLSPLSPEREWAAAARLFLKEIREYIRKRESFAFETTLSGRSYLQMIRELLDDGWQINLIYLWLPDVSHSLKRVAERVAHGGHDVPNEAIVRRFPRSIQNLLNDYAPICTTVVCLDNSDLLPNVIFTQDHGVRTIEDSDRFVLLEKGMKS